MALKLHTESLHAEPLHPNAMGAAAIGDSLADYINAQR